MLIHLLGVYHYFNENESKIQADGLAIKQSLLKMDEFLGHESKELDHSLVMNLFKNTQEYFDHENGGFGSAPKFPPCHKIDFLIRLLSDEGVEKKDKDLQFLFDLQIRDLKKFTNLISQIKQKNLKFKIIRHKQKKDAFLQRIIKNFKRN